jgi:hypothetical protein
MVHERDFIVIERRWWSDAECPYGSLVFIMNASGYLFRNGRLMHDAVEHTDEHPT